MSKFSERVMQGGVLAMLGLGALSPVQQAGVALSIAGAALGASSALASVNLPGVGIVVKKKPCCSPIIAPTDNNGVINLSGLEPGTYEVKLLGESAPVTMAVGRDGLLTTVAWEDKGRRWVEAAPRARGRSVALSARAADIVDVNTATPEALMRGTANTREAAAFIVGERQRSGPFKSPINFAQRVGPRVTADFSASPVRIGDTVIFPRGGDPKQAGFKTAAGSGVVELYGKKHNYVGHITLLK